MFVQNDKQNKTAFGSNHFRADYCIYSFVKKFLQIREIIIFFTIITIPASSEFIISQH